MNPDTALDIATLEQAALILERLRGDESTGATEYIYEVTAALKDKGITEEMEDMLNE